PAVHKAVSFLRTHRDYGELDVGLGRNYTGLSHGETRRRRREGRSNADRYFIKRTSHEPAWNFFADF
ncbi:MAG: hypothetical protein WKF96_17210, partial [Solirubrobacteraceae bacterium]